jgi:hypothetical protein
LTSVLYFEAQRCAELLRVGSGLQTPIDDYQRPLEKARFAD